ncbi:hypothetical protein XO10_09375 [Marinitoga sp. 1135]|uniref:Uncharacterized protein n=1 Tax=Marinitoga piezophila (strain DSM 14283 / JCM 11233 / KA3) TaxID=443254 RepID=H2J6D0_MARPK|nr:MULTISPECIES: hypothetical protein [Marinitoga]AEX86278.1 hypothetical protein Marpi_1898 [Marinitoga piezophila KA3]APT76685.1 hypothetical protein LN42_10065 [Marinitoga sp. 1137]NUU96454.1 hypothetical protein [Marinitoga sp. 1135]NUU98375.1 hypothetical protein [Marinitoga sp. 1138]
MPINYGNDTGKGFYKEEDLRIFLKAVESSIIKAPVKNEGRVLISDLWVISSLPKDLIIEVIETYKEELTVPEDIKEIFDDRANKILWKKEE